MLHLFTLNCTYWNWNSQCPWWQCCIRHSELYLLELKPDEFEGTVGITQLWIVPIGIETDLKLAVLYSFVHSELYLLELKQKRRLYARVETRTLNCTYWNWNLAKMLWVLLLLCLWIVPIGIETCVKQLIIWFVTLWIVPIGIETILDQSMKGLQYPLNCTYWNWNSTKASKEVWGIKLWIVPIGIETQKKREPYRCKKASELYLLELKLIMQESDSERLLLWIVPIGIETFFSRMPIQPYRLWIVPIGIETNYRNCCCPIQYRLWIVPIGIETIISYTISTYLSPLNCTYWNWNQKTGN